MKFAIRDDDTSFWTKPEELENVYKEIWAHNIPVSLAVIPFAVKSCERSDWDKLYQEAEPIEIGKNRELVDFLKDKLKTKKVSVMLHGFSHQYKVSATPYDTPVLAIKENLDKLRQSKKGEELYWYPEYIWKSYEQLRTETKEGKKYLEDLLHTEITVFVPPSNDISKDGVRAIAENGLNISGAMYLRKFNRPLNFHSMKNWLTRFWWRTRYSKVFPYVMNYGSHKELHAHGLIPGVTMEELKNSFIFCLQKDAPFVLATHHWEVNIQLDVFKTLENFINFIKTIKNTDCVFVDNLFDKTR